MYKVFTKRSNYSSANLHLFIHASLMLCSTCETFMDFDNTHTQFIKELNVPPSELVSLSYHGHEFMQKDFNETTAESKDKNFI